MVTNETSRESRETMTALGWFFIPLLAATLVSGPPDAWMLAVVFPWGLGYLLRLNPNVGYAIYFVFFVLFLTVENGKALIALRVVFIVALLANVGSCWSIHSGLSRIT